MKIPLILCNPTNYRTNRKQNIKYIVIHYTANNGDTAKGNCNYFANNSNLGASAHYFVDENEVWQSVPDNNCAWHCGGENGYKHNECRNDNAIGIEICSRKDNSDNYYFLDASVNNAIELTKYLMTKYNIDTNHVIRHFDTSGKICPAPFVKNESAWINFKNRLEVNQVEPWKQQIMDKAVQYGLITPNTHNANDMASKWFMLAVIMNLLEKYILKK